LCVVSQSVTIAHSSSVSWSRKCCSSGRSIGAGASSNVRHSGRPEKSSPSHQTVPASIASRSVCDIGGNTLRNAESTASLISLRRRIGTLSGMASSTNRTPSASASQPGRRFAHHATAIAAASVALQITPAALM
jgi:hypothetical protein